MSITSLSAATAVGLIQPPEYFLSCYEVANPTSLAWPARLYRVVRADGSGQAHGERGEIKQAIWDLRKNYSKLCRGYGFVVDIDETTVAVPASWELPSGEQVGDFRVILGQTVTTDPMRMAHRRIIAGILREAIKAHFKINRSAVLGDLWQDYDRFCQVPCERGDTEFHFCRRLGVAAKVLRDNRWVLQILISTTTFNVLAMISAVSCARLSGLVAIKSNLTPSSCNPLAISLTSCFPVTVSALSESLLTTCCPSCPLRHALICIIPSAEDLS